MTAAAPTILGISAFYHDSAACLTQGGTIVAAAQEERFSRKKHDPSFPAAAINYCLGEAFVEPEDLDAVVFYDDPLLTLDRVIKSGLSAGTQGSGQVTAALRSLLGSKVWVEDAVRRAIGSTGRTGEVLFVEHHMSHAASAFYPSPFDTAAVLTIDGVGEWATTTIGRGDGADLELFAEIDYPHSLGLLYSAFTAYCGFKVNSGEYKLMGLAPYGVPRFASVIREHLIDVREDGSYRLDTSYFGFVDGVTMTNERFHSLFGGPPRQPESRITRREMDLAASIQLVTEEVMLRLARHVKRETQETRLVLAGGVALNCVANGKILSEGIFEDIWIQPAAGDAGGALGAALLAHYQYFDQPRPSPQGRDAQRGSYLGPSFSSAEIQAFLKRGNLVARHVADGEERAGIIADAIADGMIVGHFSGRMEFGPRALGARSILGDPRDAETQSIMNVKIKFRESFRPFAPSVLAERSTDYFELSGESPYMLIVAPVVEHRRLPVDLEGFENDDMLAVINRARSDVPAITHVDYSARVQTVSQDRHPEFYAVIKAFEKATGCPVLVNTSFNVRGEPIVCTPAEAYLCFMRSGIDLLVLGEFLLWKADQKPLVNDNDWKQKYELD